ncbi:MAG: hypothetical protein KBD46_01030 [Candidatus Levybacteria bacterium]|nr:hypothetical protein [Candidatus Levybacteria bacterium]
MSKKHFYSHIVETSSISLSLGDMELTPTERKELIELVEMNIHKTILDLVLSHLSEEDKKQFLLHLHEDHHESIWNILNKRIDNIEEKIQEVATELKKQFAKDIAEAKKKR